MTILVAEDNAEVAALFVEALAAAGHQADVAATGKAALARLLDPARPCELALMDLSLPGLNGIDVVLQARAQGVTTPVIAVSGATALIDPVRLAAAGFAAAVEKPIRLSALLELVAQYLPPSPAGD